MLTKINIKVREQPKSISPPYHRRDVELCYTDSGYVNKQMKPTSFPTLEEEKKFAVALTAYMDCYFRDIQE